MKWQAASNDSPTKTRPTAIAPLQESLPGLTSPDAESLAVQDAALIDVLYRTAIETFFVTQQHDRLAYKTRQLGERLSATNVRNGDWDDAHVQLIKWEGELKGMRREIETRLELGGRQWMRLRPEARRAVAKLWNLHPSQPRSAEEAQELLKWRATLPDGPPELTAPF